LVSRRVTDFIVFLPIIALKLVFLVSYPLNISGDGYQYYTDMLLTGRAMLVHAGGYPFLWGLLLHNFRFFIESNPVAFQFILVALQHLFDLACLILLYTTARKCLGWPVAIFSLYFSGASVFYLSLVSTTTPEWFQGDLWILFICSLAIAVLEPEPRKGILFIGSIVLLEMAYLVKLNSLILVLFYIPVFLIDRAKGRPFLGGWKNLFVGIVLASSFYIVYLVGYHFPTTGTYDLQYDSGWVLVEGKQSLISTKNGIFSKRLFALNGALPENYISDRYLIDLYKSVNAVPPEFRAPYRELYEEILDKNEQQLDEFIVNYPPPITNYYYNYVIKVQYYVGLKEGDVLGKEVGYETIAANPWKYVLDTIVHTMQVMPSQWVAPFLPSVEELIRFGNLPAEDRFGFIYYAPPYYYWNQPFRTDQETSRFWLPGLALLNSCSFSVAYFVVVVLAVGILISLYLVVLKGRRDRSLLILLCLFLFLIAFDFSSNFLGLGFRWKELRAVYPILGVCVGISLNLVGSLLRRSSAGRFLGIYLGVRSAPPGAELSRNRLKNKSPD
jgi:hypothetical protein